MPAPRITRLTLLSGFALILATLSAGADQIVPGELKEYSPEALVQQSMATPSGVERTLIRAHLAERYDDHRAGHFAHAWIASHNNNEQRARALYRRCVEDDRYLPCLTNLLISDAAQEDRSLLDRVPDLLPDTPKPIVSRSIARSAFFGYVSEHDDPASAKALLRTLEERNQITAASVSFIRGLWHEYHGDGREAALTYYTKAVAAGAAGFEPYKRVVDLKLETHNINRLLRDDEAMRAVFSSVLQYIENHPGRPDGLLYLAEFFEDADMWEQSARYYRRAFDTYPMAEAAESLLDQIMPRAPQRGRAFLRQARERLVDNYSLVSYAGYVWSHYVTDVELAERAFQRALELAPTAMTRSEIGVSMGRELYEEIAFDFDTAERIYKRTSLLEDHRDNLFDLFRVNIKQGDLKEAKRLLQRIKDERQPQKSWLIARRSQLARMRKNQQGLRAYYRENPFLERWEKEYGDNLHISINFAVGKAIIPSADRGQLDDVARTLQHQDAEPYVFYIEGHTDNTGSSSVNNPLSRRRAAAVADYLASAHGIDRARLRVKGYGEQYPVEDNASADGRSRNRRVEIRPYGSIRNPRLAVTTQMGNTNAFDASADGRLFVSGYNPLSLWDMRRKVRMYGLGRSSSGPEFSPNTRYVATYSNYNEAGGYETSQFLIYDIKTGFATVQMPWTLGSIAGIAWGPFSQQLAISTSTGHVFVYDRGQGSMVARARPGSKRINGVLDWSPDGRSLYFGPAQADRLYVLDAATLKTRRTLEGVSWPHELAASPDGSRLVAADNQRQLHVWDTRSWHRRSLRIPVLAGSIDMHPTRPRVLLSNFSDDEQIQGAVVDYQRMKVVDAWADAGEGLQYNADGSLIFAAHDGSVRTHDADSQETLRVIEGSTGDADWLKKDPENDYLLAGSSTGISVWDVTTGRLVHRFDQRLQYVGRAETRSSLFYGRHGNRIFELDLRTFQLRSVAEVDFKIDRIAFDAEHLVAAGAPDHRQDMGKVMVLKLDDFTRIHATTFPIATKLLRFGRLYRAGISSLKITAESRKIVFSTRWQDGFGKGLTYADRSYVMSLTGDEPELGADYAEDDGAPEDDGSDIELTGRTHIRIKSPGAKPASIVYPDNIDSYEAFPDRNLLVIQTLHNELGFHDLATGKRQLTIVPFRDGEWIAYAPSGHYTASLKGERNAYWFLGDASLPLDNLRDRFEQPHLIHRQLERLANSDPGAGDMATQENAEIAADIFTPPYSVERVSPTDVETGQASYKLVLKIDKHRANLPDPQIEYTLNGHVQPNSRTIVREEIETTDTENLRVAETFDLEPGRNVIQAALLYKNTRIEPVTARVERNIAGNNATSPADIARQQRGSTRLFFFGVGVSKYADPDMNLDYAHRDAERLAQTLENKGANLFGEVRTRVVTNQKATARDIRVGMHDFLRQASSQDVIVLFLAGHGAQDSEQTLYFMPHNSDIERPYSGLDMSIFHDFLRKRPRSQKALLWMDICHAGSLGRELRARGNGRITIEDAVQQVADGTGISVLASSTGREVSVESERFGGGHGAFTASLLEALKGDGDKKTGDGDGYVTVQEMQTFVTRRVPELTNGKQHPTVPTADNFRDFPLTQ